MPNNMKNQTNKLISCTFQARAEIKPHFLTIESMSAENIRGKQQDREESGIMNRRTQGLSVGIKIKTI